MILFLPIIPLVGALLILLTPSTQESLLRRITLVASIIPGIIVLTLFSQFSLDISGYQFVQTYSWLPSMGIQYQVGLDGINMTMCLLHALVSVSGAFMACKTEVRKKEYLFFYLVLIAGVYGVFTVLDLFFLYLFYEMTLIPLYPMIGIWGSKNKEYGAMKLTLFITSGAVLALFGIMLFYQELGAKSFDLIFLQQGKAGNFLSNDFQIMLAPLLLIGFGVMASLWPLHSWSPIGYAAAPTSVSMLHAGVLKKMGPYLIFRLVITFLPEGMLHWSHVLAILAGIGILYAGYAAIKQTDLKFIIGFSSVSHMGYVLLGMAAMTPVALSGAVLLMFSHGVMAACTFALIGFVYEQTHTRGIGDFGGLVKKVPFIGICFVMVSMASLGLPGFSNFASELLVFIGSWPKYPVIVGFAVFGILITAVYLLRLLQRVCYGNVNPALNNLKDAVSLVDKLPFLLLIGGLLLFGFWPQGLIRIILPTIEALLS